MSKEALASNLYNIIRAADATAQSYLFALKNVKGVKEGQKFLVEFGERMAELMTKYGQGKMTHTATKRALRSESEALAFNLAAIGKKHARTWLEEMLSSTLKAVIALIVK